MLWTVAYQVPLSMGFSRQEYWGGLSWPPPGDLPNQGIEPMSPMSSAFSSIQFSHSVVSDSLQSHELQHIKLPCPSPTPRACSNSCPLSQWCHPTISSPVIPFSSCLQSFPESGSFPMSQIFTSGGQSGSFRFSISPSNDYSELISFMIVWFDLLAVQGTLKSLLQHHSSKASILWHSAFFIFQLSHPYMIPGKTIALTRWTFVGKVMSLLFNMLSRVVITLLPRSKRLLISWLQYQIVRTHTEQTLEYKIWHHPTTSSTLCKTPHLNNKQNKNTNPIISRQDYHLTQPCPSEEKQTSKQTNKHSA